MQFTWPKKKHLMLTFLLNVIPTFTVQKWRNRAWTMTLWRSPVLYKPTPTGLDHVSICDELAVRMGWIDIYDKPVLTRKRQLLTTHNYVYCGLDLYGRMTVANEEVRRHSIKIDKVRVRKWIGWMDGTQNFHKGDWHSSPMWNQVKVQLFRVWSYETWLTAQNKKTCFPEDEYLQNEWHSQSASVVPYV